MPLGTIADLNSIWRDLIAQSDPDTARRLQQDAGMRLDARQLTIQLNRDATRGFTVTIDQLLQHRSFWVPGSICSSPSATTRRRWTPIGKK